RVEIQIPRRRSTGSLDRRPRIQGRHPERGSTVLARPDQDQTQRSARRVRGKPTMRIAIVTTYPPGTGSLNEYAGHFVGAFQQKREVEETILLVDELPAGQRYPEEPQTTIVPCWRFGDVRNARRILSAVRRTKPDVVLFNIQFASFG